MRARSLGVLLLSMTPLSAAGGCNSCAAKCVGPQVEISVGSGVRRVSVCDAGGACTTQDYTASTPEALGKTFTVIVVQRDGRLPVKVDVDTVDGRHLGPTTLEPKATKGSCGCPGPGRIHVGPDGAGLFDG